MCCRPGTSRPGFISRPRCSPPSATARRTGAGPGGGRRARRCHARDGRHISAMSATCRSTARSRPALGNDLYGSFGRDFATADGRRDHDHRADPAAVARARPRHRARRQAGDGRAGAGRRPRHRDRPLRGARRDRRAARAAGAPARRWPRSTRSSPAAACCGGRSRISSTLVRDDPRCSPANPLFAEVDQPGIGRYLMPGLPLDFSASPRAADPPGAAARRSTPTRSSPRCSAFPPPRSAGCTMPASPPGRRGASNGRAAEPDH